MKAKSKLLALLLSLVMVFSLMVPAFAADDKAEGETDAPVATESAEPTEDEYPAESAEPSAPAEPELKGTIVILHTNDVHGGIAGYAKVAALKAKYEAEGAFVLLVDAGDFSQGDPVVSVSEGATAVELMDLAGYDVATLGNHEFDYGYENLKKITKDAKFQIVAANVLYEGKVAF